MKSLAVGALVDALRTQTARARERTRVAEWCRHNATIQRGLPALPDNDDTELGLLYAISTETVSEDGGQGEVAREPDAGGAAIAGGGEASATAAANRQSDANASGQVAGGGATTHQGTGAGDTGAAGDRDSRRAWTPWRWIGAALVGAGLLGGGAGAGALISAWLDDGDESNKSSESTVIVQPGDQSLYQWLEDHGHHLPPHGIPDG